MPTVQRRVSLVGKVSYRVLVRLKGYKSKTATFLKRADAVTWGQEIETKIRQSKYFPDRLIESEKYTLSDLLNRYKSEVLPDKRSKGQLGQLEWWKVQLGECKLKDLAPPFIAEYRDKLIKEKSNQTGRNRAAAIVNRYQGMAVNPVIQISKPREAQGFSLMKRGRDFLLSVSQARVFIYLPLLL